MVDSPRHAVWRRLERIPSFARAADPDAPQWSWKDLVAVVGIMGIATFLRWVAGPYLPPGYPFLTYFPAVVITGFIYGFYTGLSGALVGGILAWFLFIAPSETFVLNPQIAVALGFYVLVVCIDLGLIHFALKAYGEQARIRKQLLRLADEKRLIDREIDHRVKNLFSLLAALVTLSQRESETTRAMGERLRSRIIAMSRSHALLRISPDGAVSLLPALKEALEPFAVGEAISLEGADLRITGEAALHLSMVLHELATNAAKYGALASAGKIRLDWVVEGEGEAEAICFNWVESGCPVEDKALSTGFGSELVDRLVQSMGGTVSARLDPNGLVAELRFPTARLLARTNG